MILDPSMRTGTDFIAFYAAGRVAEQHDMSKAYNIDLQRQVEEKESNIELEERHVLLYNHMPYLIPVLSALVTENYTTSFIRWALLMLASHVLGCALLVFNLKRKPDEAFSHPLFWGAVLFFPFFQSVLLGQDSALLFLGVVLWFAGLKKNNDWLAAAGLALCTVRPHICLILAIPMLFQKRGVAWRAILTGGGLALVSVLLIGSNGTLDFLKILQISAGGTWFGMNEKDMLNLIGLVYRLFPALPAELIRILGWVGFAAGMGASVWVWQKTNPSQASKLGLSILIALFLVPHLHYHDLTLLIVPLAFLKWGDERAAYLPLGISLFLLFLNPLYYVLPYILFACLGWLLVHRSSWFESAMPPNPTG